MAPRVTATPAAVEMVERLTRQHGPLAFFQSGGCCAGSAPMCLGREEMPPGANDICLGEVGGAGFYVDRELYARWHQPRLVIDVAAGAAGGFSLEGPEDVHFVSRPQAQ
jgi:uncharacterized protein (DUF779 family)